MVGLDGSELARTADENRAWDYVPQSRWISCPLIQEFLPDVLADE